MQKVRQMLAQTAEARCFMPKNDEGPACGAFHLVHLSAC